MANTTNHKQVAEDTLELKPIEPSCPQCGYDLRSLTNTSGARCPECGSQLPFDRLKFRHDRKEQRRYCRPRPLNYSRWFRWSLLEKLVVIIVIGFTVGILVFVLRNQPRLLVPLPAVVLGIVIAEFVIRWKHRWQRRRYERQRAQKKRRPTEYEC